MLLTLHEQGFVMLDPDRRREEPGDRRQETAEADDRSRDRPHDAARAAVAGRADRRRTTSPITATPTPALDKLLVFRAVHPLYGAFLLDHLGTADRDERMQAVRERAGTAAAAAEVRPRAVRAAAGAAPDREARPGTDRDAA